MSQMLDHVLDYVLDHVVDHMIISLMTTALHYKSCQKLILKLEN